MNATPRFASALAVRRVGLLFLVAGLFAACGPDRQAELATVPLMRPSDMQAIGDAVSREAMLAAAESIEQGTPYRDTVNVTLEFTLTVRPPEPPSDWPDLESPEDIDVCWQLASTTQQYIDCSAPHPPETNMCAWAWSRFVDAWRRQDAAAMAEAKRDMEIACAQATP